MFRCVVLQWCNLLFVPLKPMLTELGIDGIAHFFWSPEWIPENHVDLCMANQSLHRFVELETLFDTIRDAIGSIGLSVVPDMIGRNGHMRWPEALEPVQKIPGRVACALPDAVQLLVADSGG